MDFSGFFNWLPQVPFVPLSTAIVSGVILATVGPQSNVLGLHEHRLWIAIVFLIAAVLVLSQILHAVWQWGTGKLATRRDSKTQLARLRAITHDEIHILKTFILNRRRSQALEASHESVIALTHAKIIEQKDQPGYTTYNATFILAEWAWEYLNANRQLLGIKDTTPAGG